ncbi:MAG: hypothetical protein P8L41_08180 [Paracoccaceae bacterium]|nr:hypothetical protein [Paracoccaceae bacterium]
MPQQFGLDGFEEDFHDGIVVTICSPIRHQKITSNGYISPSGARIAPKDHLTGAVYEAQ